jgi:hypothetical protein
MSLRSVKRLQRKRGQSTLSVRLRTNLDTSKLAILNGSPGFAWAAATKNVLPSFLSEVEPAVGFEPTTC